MTTAADGGQFAIGGDLPVHRLGFGALWLTGPDFWGDPDHPARCVALLRDVVRLGVNLIDTADAYGPETSERLIREALFPYPQDLVIATKGGYVRPSPHEWAPIGRPEYLIHAAKRSARRLGVDTIDLWQLHRIDPRVPMHDQFGAIASLRQQGVVRHVGLSEVSIEDLRIAQNYFPVATVQNRYNLRDRSSEALLRLCDELGIGFMPWSPLGQRSLLGRAGGLSKAAGDRGVSESQMALAWLLAKSPVMMPIPGTQSLAHLKENVAAASLQLSPADLEALASVV